MFYNERSVAIRWQIPDFLSDDNSDVCSIFHDILMFLMFDLESSGQGHSVQHL